MSTAKRRCYGCSGIRCEFANELAEVAKALGPGKAVKLIWTREDDVRGGLYRPIFVHRLRGAVHKKARSVALFEEAGKVIQHPRCVNCHPAGDRPLQTDAGRPHEPLVVRGPDGHGAPAMECSSCHHDANFDPARVPGHPKWHLAPLSMAWEGKSLAFICEQIKDPKRNSG